MRLGLLLAFALFLFGEGDPQHVRLTLQVEPPYDVPRGEPVMPVLARNLEERLRELMVEATIETQSDRIVIDMPRVEDPERVRQILTRNVFLDFRFVRFPERGGGSPSPEAVLEHFGGQFPSELELLQGNVPEGRQYYAVERAAVATTRDIGFALPSRSQFNQPTVHVVFSPEAGEAFGRATEANIGSAMAIVLDGEVISAPVINRITRECIIEGGLTEREAQDLVVLLSARPLPARLRVVDQQISKAAPSRRFWLSLAMIALAVFFVLFVAFLVVLYRRGGRPRPA